MTTNAATADRRSFADLLAAARATAAAYFDGDPTAMATLIDHLDAMGELPEPAYWPTAAALGAVDGPVTGRRIA